LISPTSARQANYLGVHGLICAPDEGAMVRPLVDQMKIVTLGVRPEGADWADQKRAAPPRTALSFGADYLVVRRPITQAGDPLAATCTISKE
jgi:orotidine-5'-phosphate decarboxylase